MQSSGSESEQAALVFVPGRPLLGGCPAYVAEEY